MSVVDSLTHGDMDPDPIVERMDVDPRVIFAAEEAPSGELAAQVESIHSPGPDLDFVANVDQIRTVHRNSITNKYAAVPFTPHPHEAVPDPHTVVPQAIARHLTFDDAAVDHMTTRLDNWAQRKSSRRAKNLCYAIKTIEHMCCDNNEVESHENQQRYHYAADLAGELMKAHANSNR